MNSIVVNATPTEWARRVRIELRGTDAALTRNGKGREEILENLRMRLGDELKPLRPDQLGDYLGALADTYLPEKFLEPSKQLQAVVRPVESSPEEQARQLAVALQRADDATRHRVADILKGVLPAPPPPPAPAPLSSSQDASRSEAEAILKSAGLQAEGFNLASLAKVLVTVAKGADALTSLAWLMWVEEGYIGAGGSFGGSSEHIPKFGDARWLDRALASAYGAPSARPWTRIEEHANFCYIFSAVLWSAFLSSARFLENDLMARLGPATIQAQANQRQVTPWERYRAVWKEEPIKTVLSERYKQRIIREVQSHSELSKVLQPK
ncbi:MAG: hypothetical protein IT581_17910 [Verrucomicrobiales bacterium]|nr:hypothetical protein [Verrucomicrobiales bacterium]